jgi:hypothetical protein
MSMFKMASALARRRTVRPCAPTLARFAQEIRPAVARVAERDERLRDLAVAFPALLHRLAVEPSAARSARAVEIVRAGGSLKAAGFAAGLPFWTRKLPPEAFGKVSPELPDGRLFAMRVANALPRDHKTAAAWAAAVAEAARWGDPAAALWAARECADPAGLTPEEARLVALHAWFAKRPETRGGALAGGRWAAAIGREAGIEKARAWLDRLYEYFALGDGVDPWLEDGAADGYDFVAIATAEAIAAEAEAMSNCVRSYACEIAQDYERLFSIRRGGVRVATLSVAFPTDAPFLQLTQLKGPANAPAAPEVWFAARRWVMAQTPARREPDGDGGAIDRLRWIAIWRPWWVARRRFPAELPLRADGRAFGAFYGHRPYRGRRRRRRA